MFGLDFMHIDMLFIVTTPGDTSSSPTRRLIRSHVMLGKNKGRPRPIKRRNPFPQRISMAWESTAGGIPDHLVSVPRRVGSDWSFTRLADEIEPAALADILRCKCMCNLDRIETLLTLSRSSLPRCETSDCPIVSLLRLPQERRRWPPCPTGAGCRVPPCRCSWYTIVSRVNGRLRHNPNG
jgi:hypothetical protein